jgi:ATP-binding cassette subfamily F protein uup
VGGYSDWLRQRAPGPESREKPARLARVKHEKPPQARPRLGYKQKRELESLPERIEALEVELARLQARLADPAFYKEEGAEIVGTRGALDQVQSELQTYYARWAQLEALAGDN